MPNVKKPNTPIKPSKKKFHIKMQVGESIQQFNDLEKAREMLGKLTDITGGHGLFIHFASENFTKKDKVKYGNDFLMKKKATA